MALEPPMPLRAEARASDRPLIGRPMTVMNRPIVISVDTIGMTTTGMTPRTFLCTFQLATHLAR